MAVGGSVGAARARIHVTVLGTAKLDNTTARCAFRTLFFCWVLVGDPRWVKVCVIPLMIYVLPPVLRFVDRVACAINRIYQGGNKPVVWERGLEGREALRAFVRHLHHYSRS